MDEIGLEQYSDMPREIFNNIMKFSAALDKLCTLRKTRKKQKAALVDHYAHRINGDRIVMNNRLALVQQNAQKIDDERVRNSKLVDKNWAQEKEIKALKEKNAHLQAQIRCMEAPTPV